MLYLGETPKNYTWHHEDQASFDRVSKTHAGCGGVWEAGEKKGLEPIDTVTGCRSLKESHPCQERDRQARISCALR